MIDFHVHSNISDGSDTPIEIITKAKAKNLYAIALTDHDSIDGLEIASNAAEKENINFIKGIELSVAFGKNRLVHILGLGINPEHPELLEGYSNYRQRREDKLDAVFEGLKQMGICPSVDEVFQYATSGRLDRQAIAKWLVVNNYASTMSRAWIDILDKIPYIEGELIEVEEALHIIKASGGVSFLAHYTKPIGLYGYSMTEKEERLIRLKEMGLDGIERYYPTFTKDNEKEVDYYIEKFGFMASGGSDYHGKNRPNIDLGIGEGDFVVPDIIYDNLMERIN